MSDEMKPCPFCGATPNASDPRTFLATQGEKWGAVMCCGSGPEVRTDYQDVEHWRDKAIAAWNERAPPPEVAPIQRAEVVATLLKATKDIPPEFAKVVDEHFWDLINGRPPQNGRDTNG